MDWCVVECWQNCCENHNWSWQKQMYLLTRTQSPFEAQAVEVVTFAVFAPHLTKLICMAGALSAQTVASTAADGAAWLRDAVGVIRWTVVLHWALTSWAQTAWVTLTDAALVGPIAVATEGAVGFRLCLTVTVTCKIHRDLQWVLEASRFDGEGAALLFGASTQLSLHAEWHLNRGDVFMTVCMFRYQMSMSASQLIRTVSPTLRPEQDLSPGMTSSFRQVALKERFNSSGTPSCSSSTLERIFCST